MDVDQLDSLDVIEAVALGYPIGQSIPSTSSTTFGTSTSSVEDLEKGNVVTPTLQHDLGTKPQTVSGVTLVTKTGDTPRPSGDGSRKVSPLDADLRQLPTKRHTPLWRRLRHRLVSVYQRLFSIVFIANAIALLVTLVLNRDHTPFGPSIANVSTAVAANVTCTILIRQEYIINALYDILCWTPLSIPLRVRRIIAKLYHFGGIHSGCAMAAVMWFILFTGLLTTQYVKGQFRNTAVLTVTYVLLVLLVAICFFALPRFRVIFHNAFEAIHRFGGWLAVALFWILTLLICHAESKLPGSRSMGRLVVTSPSFWLLTFVTFCIIFPWIRLRKVPARAELLSSHAVRLHFTYLNKIGPVVGIRLATSPLKEWHAFATIPSDNNSCFSVLVSDAGDWTKKQIANPQARYWVRGIPIVGVLRMATVFKSVVIVATGSGIGPVLSLVVGSGRMPQTRILWSTPNPLQTFGQGIIDSVQSADKDALIWNTRERGRPDMVGLTYHLFAESGAEAVFVISNPALTRKIVYAMESRGVPAYGPIWDS